ncbi:MAG: chemotaxis protein CheD [Acidobacteria bacterium]|nr:chemotaxis protein CheD [Acidobacteriota bacterium]
MLAVGVGDLKVSGKSGETLVTYGLGSCIGVAIWDPVARVGGLLHFMLPESQSDPQKAKLNPALYADTGIPTLFKSAYQLGADKKRLQVRVAGGAQVLDGDGVFNIGKRNYLAMKKIFWKAGVMVHAEEVGGNVSRTLRLEVGTGKLLLQEAGEEAREIGLRACA